MSLRLIFAVLAMNCSAAIAAGDAVITEWFSGTTLRGEKGSFLVGEVISIKKEKESTIVESDSSPWVAMAVPSSHYVTRESFEMVTSWKGEGHLDLVAGDYSVDYYFEPNGAFTMKYWDYEKGRQVGVGGHLFRSKNIFWAKTYMTKHLRKESMFVQMPNGGLCWPVPAADCN